jgi:hypothetical protein
MSSNTSSRPKTLNANDDYNDKDEGFFENPTSSRALMLLQQATASAYQDEHGKLNKTNADSFVQHPNQHHHHIPLTTRKAAQLNYQVHQAEKAKMKVKFEKDRQQFAKPIPKLTVPIVLEKQATSTRPRKPLTDEDVRDPETIAGMKFQLQWEQETKAQAKSRRLLKFLDTEIA